MPSSPELKASLSKKRSELLVELERLTAAPEQGASVGFGKRIGDGTAEAVERLATTAAARSLWTSVVEIDSALQRLDDGSYGSCESCGQPIGAERLVARPASVRCVGCADL